MKDLRRLELKHEKFYGVNDAGMVVKGSDHLFPNISGHVGEPKKLNAIMLRKSELRA